MSNVRFPWQDAMTLGLGTLRLAPETFWCMTLPELAAAARAVNPSAPASMNRTGLLNLMARYPD
ncbi:MAG: phage tail assembly chaperone [Alphaproteobacteria bacterium HGW-Alphaproteobacteria-12]|nr:MAG: phage tail assembly chaperone [Alphaproteobacteria bacterium HGW-Alphaproteobacteria-12]